ncbi:ATP/GTP-binding protein [Agromyces protaetiae]|uniref:ATP/GTP-binding protein n=1 Tax=Agromyces protaetiae TaxID=2509455 RepID=UPI001FB72FD0|nr:ATP/GTP-binding protein [Agromyces protaetiae]
MNRSLEQHIAVFGESGSGKTVLLSSFYGPTQEPGFAKENLYEVIAESASQGLTLHQNYLGMRNDARAPEPNRFRSHSYAFRVKPKVNPDSRAQRAQPVDNLRLVWHDYPGEWFEQDVEGEEAQRRVDTFRSLLGSDVAFLLVDAQRLIDNVGQEERYLKSLFSNFRTGLVRLEDEILVGGQPLVEFPRIWVVALSKADLLPDLDVQAFKELIVLKAAGELSMLTDTIRDMVQGGAALSVGDDFVLFSSAKFSPEKIDLTSPIGLDLILPLAAILPFERHARWIEQRAANKLPEKVVENLFAGASVLVGLLLTKRFNMPGPVGLVVGLVTSVFSKDVIEGLLNMAREKLEDARSRALEKKEYFTAVLTGFRLALIEGEERRVLRLSRR